MARSKAREIAFKLLFEDTFGVDTAEEMFGNLFEEEENYKTLSEEDMQYIAWVRQNVKAHQDELDAIISELAKGWSIERINRVDLALMRLALCEIIYRDDVSAAIAINEAVEKAKLYSSDEGPGFINGILGAYVRSK